MTSKAIDWLAILTDFVRRNPKTSAAVAFNLGIFAGRAAKQQKALRSGVVEIPAKLIELVPSMKDIGTYVPLIGGKPAPKARHRRAPARKSVRKKTTQARRKAAH